MLLTGSLHPSSLLQFLIDISLPGCICTALLAFVSIYVPYKICQSKTAGGNESHIWDLPPAFKHYRQFFFTTMKLRCVVCCNWYHYIALPIKSYPILIFILVYSIELLMLSDFIDTYQSRFREISITRWYTRLFSQVCMLWSPDWSSQCRAL